ncbi:MAG: SPOR domain-containing protein [Bacteroidota bacterium]|nr:SPOR domain-containing protein [Bacteroidota bacterium]
MDVKAIIRELLFSHDCVIIPGFGGFIANFYPASIDRNTGTFNPPVRKISFNRNLNHNDGLLISKISRVAGLNYGDARNIAEEFAHNLNSRILRGEKVVIDHLGAFTTNYENSIQFEPDEDINYYLDSYGLEPFQYLPAKEYDVRKRIIRRNDFGPIRNRSTRKNLWRAAIIVPLLALLVAIPLKTDLFRTKTETANLNPLVTAEFENNKKAVDEAAAYKLPDSALIVKQPESIPSAPVPVPAETKPVPSEPAPVAPAEKHYYGIITGSFKSEKNAISQVNKLKSQGFEPEINQATNGFYRVIAMKCADLETAKEKADSISGKFPGTWISKR